jgi:RimJ/RimL family protein N-acetyltransferase
MVPALPFGPAAWREVIVTPRLRLVPLTRADARELVGVLDDRALHRHTGGEPLDEPALTRRYARLETGVAPDGSAVWANWVVRLRASGEAVGYVQATVGEDGADVAWVIGTARQRQGYGAEAVGAMAAWLHEAGVGVLLAHIHPDNAASQRLALRAGFRTNGTVDDAGEIIWEARPSPRDGL